MITPAAFATGIRPSVPDPAVNMLAFTLPTPIVAVPVTLSEPLNASDVYVTSPVVLIVLPAARVVAVVALPAKEAVMVPALKLPLASRATIVDTVFSLVASVVIVTSVEPLKGPPDKWVPVANDFVVDEAIVIFCDPSNVTPLIVRPVSKMVALSAFAAVPVVF